MRFCVVLLLSMSLTVTAAPALDTAAPGDRPARDTKLGRSAGARQERHDRHQPAAGVGGGAPGAHGGRQRRGRRDHRGGGAERGRADDVRHRRRPVRALLRSGNGDAPRPERHRTRRGAVGRREAPRRRPHADAGKRPPRGDRARSARRLGGTGEPLRNAAARRAAPAGHPARRGGVSGVRGHLGPVEAGRRQTRPAIRRPRPPTSWTGSARPSTGRSSARRTSRRRSARSPRRARTSSTGARSPRRSTTSWRRRAAS